MRMRIRMGGWGALVLALALASATPARAGHSIYLALGDSITFGVGADDSDKDISAGDRGYVGRYADYLMGANGPRPSVVNLAISGETSASFLGQGFGLDGPGAPARNVNYLAPANAGMSQYQLMEQTIASLTNPNDPTTAGNTIDHVTLTLGANDLYVALATGADFATTLNNFASNEAMILGEIRKLLPSTSIALLNYYDPYAPFLSDPTSPLYPYAVASSQAIPLLNATIAQEAAAFGASDVDVYGQFPASTILDETYIKDGGNTHPKNVGYDRITAALEAAPAPAAVPELASLLLTGLGLGGVAAVGRWRLRGRATLAA